MTTKDFVLFVLVGGVAGLAAAFGATMAREPAVGASAPDDLAARLDRIETALARAAEGQKEAKESVTKLNERVTALQIDVSTAHEESLRAKAETAAADVEAAGRPGRAKRPLAVTSPGNNGTTPPTFTFGGQIGEGVRLDGGSLVIDDAMKVRLAGLSEGLRLRMLPEADRWKKAQDDLHLTDGQIDNLKAAITARDTAMRESMQIETSNENGNSNITIRRVDPAKAATAQQEYDRQVTNVLDSEQKKSWDEKGYNRAFGGSGGGAVMIASSSSIDFAPDALVPPGGTNNK
ncbi:MAG: hypothetical protein K8T90_19540 [Planctomycetes bacterium]|nr:hypothetical protein [Planctomycetota bacterium]